MKKALLFSVCCAALATACTNEESAFEQPKNDAKGIIFDTTIEGSVTANTRGELTNENGKYPFFWYAEQDRINVYADNVVAAASNQDAVGVVANWAALGDPAIYKATQSASRGLFTAKDDANWINFKDNEKIHIVASYPTTTTVTSASQDTETKAITSIELAVAKTNAAQSVKFNQIDAPMYSISEGQRVADYQSVGERANLSLKRAFPALRFSSAKGNDTYNKVLGKLTSIEVTMLGSGDADADGFKLEASKIAATSATYSTADLKADNIGTLCNEPTLTGEAATIETTLATPALWNSSDYVFTSIYPVKREAENSGNKKQMTEKYTVTYAYENVDLTKNLSTKADWNYENAVYEIEALDIAKDFPYIVTKNEETLMVFSGAFSDIDVEGKPAMIAWNNSEVAKNKIKTIISDVELTEAEMKTLSAQFSALTSLTLNKNTKIAKNTFSTTQAAQMTELVLPLVTVYEDENNFEALVDLDINSYKFNEDNVYKRFFNDNTKATLETLKIEAMESMRPTFGYDRVITFQDYEVLEEVALNPNGVALTANAFKGCVALTSVTGIVDITNAPSAFENAGADVTGKTLTINVEGTIIPSSAFKGSNVASVLESGKNVVPTEIGASAFENNTVIKVMDLSKATTIGANAFKGATAFTGVAFTEQNRGVVTINVETINDGILDGTAVVRVQFAKATKIGNNIFGSTPNAALKQIKFLQKVTNKISDTATTPFSANFTSVDLFIALAQDDMTDLTWLGGTFKTITREDKPFGE